jgi:hypothetical protein
MRALDWLVVAIVALAIFNALLMPIIGKVDLMLRVTAPILAVVASVPLLAFLWLYDGAHSPLWRWLPPFYPWGKYLRSVRSRQVFITLLVAFSIACAAWHLLHGSKAVI